MYCANLKCWQSAFCDLHEAENPLKSGTTTSNSEKKVEEVQQVAGVLVNAQSGISKLHLPEWITVLCFLSTTELVKFGEISRACAQLASDDQIWKGALKGVVVCGLTCKEAYRKVVAEAAATKQEENYWNEKTYASYACGMRMGSPRMEEHMLPENLETGAIGGFPAHPDSSSSVILDFTFDIETACQRTLDLELHLKYPIFKDEKFVAVALQRYERFLMLKAKHPSLYLVPTLDIELVWRSHLLRPSKYAADCLRLGDRVIPHRIIASDEEWALRVEATRATAALWKTEYGQEYTKYPIPEVLAELRFNRGPFSGTRDVRTRALFWSDLPLEDFIFEEIEGDDPEISNGDENGSRKPNIPSFGPGAKQQVRWQADLDSEWAKWLIEQASSNTTAAASEQKSQISLSVKDVVKDRSWINLFQAHGQRRFGSDDSWTRVVKAYERFLYLSLKYPMKDNQLAHPTYAIDLVWHAHMLHPLEYTADMLRWMGCSMDHEPWPEVSEELMDNALKCTERYWEKEFGVDMQKDHQILRVTKQPSTALIALY